MQSGLERFIYCLKYLIVSFIARCLSPFVRHILLNHIRVWGDKSRLRIALTARMANTLFNVTSGQIIVGDDSFTGHNVSILTGTHLYNTTMQDRHLKYPTEGYDVIIGKGVWIGTNAIIIGPCNVGDHAVIAAGAIVTSDVPERAIVMGKAAKVVKYIQLDE